MKNKLITIIVPIYNVEKYIDRCINSIINQTYKNIEIILIDDGSPDNCPKICDEYAKKDKRIKVIHKKNEGLGKARNSGIKISKGDYITFVDSDDYIDDDLVESTVNVINKYNPDVIIYGCYSERENKTIINTPKPKKNHYIGDEVLKDFLPDFISYDPKDCIERNIPKSFCCSMYKSEILKKNGFSFESERKIISEDYYAVINLYKYINSVFLIDRCFYHYCLNLSSLTHKYIDNRYEKIKYFYEQLKKSCKENNYSDEVLNRIKYPFLNFTIANMKLIAGNKELKLKEKKEKISEIVLDDLMMEIINSVNIEKEPFQRKTIFSLIRNKRIKLLLLVLFLKNMY